MLTTLGTQLQAKDRKENWLSAKVFLERGEGESREVKVHFHGWSKKEDEWLLAGGDRLLPLGAPLPDQHPVERLLKKRKNGGEYLCRWLNFGEDHDSWEPAENIHDDIIKEYEATRDAEEEAKEVAKLAD